MKKFGILTLLIFFILQGFSQEITAVNKDTTGSTGNPADTNDVTRIIVGNDRMSVENDRSNFNIRIGDRGLSILESLEGRGPKLEFKKYPERDPEPWYQDNDPSDRRRYRRNRFRGHWTGVDLGFNNYVTSDRSLSLPGNIDYMTLHSGKSMNFNINFSQLSLGLTRHIGFVTGLGFNWNNYRFDGNNNITKGAEGIIEPLIPAETLEKSKLTTIYLTLPFMLELQVPTDRNRINIAGGPIGAVKLNSHSKMVFEDGQKIKSNSDFSLNLLRYGATARVGYGNFQVYGTYYLTPLFKSDKSPGNVDLYPFEVGIAFSIND